jgi:hypothetical protein
MLHLLLCTALAPLAIAADAAPPVGTQLTYRGTLEPVSDGAAADPQKGQKTFDLSLWIMGRGESGTDVFWIVDERGNGQFPWPARFGRATLDAHYHTAAPGAALLYDRGEGRSVVALRLPFFAAQDALAAGADFRDGQLEYHVDKSTTSAQRPVWQLSVRDQFGAKRMLLVDKTPPLVMAMTERVTMGRGEPYQLRLEFVESQQLTGEQLAALAAALERASAVRDKLNLPAAVQQIDWNDQQLAWLKDGLDALEKSAAGTPLAKLAAAAQRDFKLQTDRHDALGTLADKFRGSAVEDFSARGFGDESLARADLDGQVTVLHFWDYRDEPLHEPYGQVGYLDFLYHRRKDAGLRLFGVAVNPRLGEESTRAGAERSVKKLKAFMNLSYPVLLDSGALLKQFGDPRVVGANLPLFVVVGRDGKILHYHVGTYEVHQDQGLAELDEVVSKALQNK